MKGEKGVKKKSFQGVAPEFKAGSEQDDDEGDFPMKDQR